MKLTQADFELRRDRLAQHMGKTVLPLLKPVLLPIVTVMRTINSVPIAVFSI